MCLREKVETQEHTRKEKMWGHSKVFSVKVAISKPRTQATGETKPGHTVTWDVKAAGLWENKWLSLKPSCLWNIVQQPYQPDARGKDWYNFGGKGNWPVRAQSSTQPTGVCHENQPYSKLLYHLSMQCDQLPSFVLFHFLFLQRRTCFILFCLGKMQEYNCQLPTCA